MTILSLKNVGYTHKKTNATLLDGINIDFSLGKMYGILGKSELPKSTLLALIMGMDLATEGEILFNEQNLKNINQDAYRRTKIGTLLSFFNALENGSVLENLRLCTYLSSQETKNNSFFYNHLKKVGLDQRLANQKLKKLSLADQQRVYLVKAMINNPKIILIEEPFETLNELPLEMSMYYLRMYAKNEDKCIIISSKEKQIADYVDELWGLNSGKLVFIKDNDIKAEY